MSNESGGGLGNCLITILVILVFLAAFGFVNWSTVGTFARFIVYLVIAGVIFIVAMMVWASAKKD